MHAGQHMRYHERLAPRELTVKDGTTMSIIFRTRPASQTGGAPRTLDFSTNQQQASPTAQSSKFGIGAPVQATSTVGDSDSDSPGSSPTPTSASNNDNQGNNSDNSNNDNSSPSPIDTSSGNAGFITTGTIAFTTMSTAITTGGNNRLTSSPSSNSISSSETDVPTSSSSSEGMSVGGKIGLAVGIIGIIGLVAIIALVLLKKKRKQKEALEKAEEDEKRAAAQAAADAAAAAKATDAPRAPRLSLRPVSKLVPELMGGARSRSRLSQGNMVGSNQQGPGSRSLSPASTMQPGQPRDNPFNDPVNPFTDPEKAAAAGALPQIGSATPQMSGPGAVPAAAMAAGAMAYNNQHPHAHELEDTRSASYGSRSGMGPNGSPHVAPAPAVATGPGSDQPGNVYRVLMDFKPTMEDELELRNGTHVRLLHEYDDGWALCIRLDRSQQGVVPRTCLAPKPSKPRPPPGQGPQPFRQGPPINPATGRPMTPKSPGPRMNGPQGHGAPSFRSASPAQSLPYGAPSPRSTTPGNDPRQRGEGRSMTPPDGTPQQGYSRPMSPGGFNQAPRPLSPGPRPQKRSQSPGPYGANGPRPMTDASQRRRSNSVGAPNSQPRRNQPAGPGMAM